MAALKAAEDWRSQGCAAGKTGDFVLHHLGSEGRPFGFLLLLVRHLLLEAMHMASCILAQNWDPIVVMSYVLSGFWEVWALSANWQVCEALTHPSAHSLLKHHTIPQRMNKQLQHSIRSHHVGPHCITLHHTTAHPWSSSRAS